MSEQELPTVRPVPTPPSPVAFSLAPDLSAAGGDEEKKGPGLRRYVAVVARYKWLALGIVVLGIGIGTLASRRASRLYSAEARLWLSVSDQTMREQGPIQSAQLLQQDAWAELVRTQQVLTWVVVDQRLYVQYPGSVRAVMDGFTVDSAYLPGRYVLAVSKDGRSMQLRLDDGRVVDTAPVGQPIGRRLGFSFQPRADALKPGQEVAFRVVAVYDAARSLGQRIDVQVARQGNFMALSYSGTNPEKVAAVLNSLLDRYVAVAADLKRARLKELRDILQDQLERSETYLKEAELALEGFRIRTITLPSEPATPVAPGLEETRQSTLDRYFQLKIERDQLARDAQAIEAAVSDVNPISTDALNMIGSVQQSPELTRTITELTEKRAAMRALMQQWTDDAPVVRRARADVDSLERGVIPRLALALSSELHNRIATLDGLVSSSGEELKQIPPRAIEQARMQRAVATAENLYTDLRQRYETARLATETTVPDVRVLDAAAVPNRPSSDRRLQVLLIAILLSLGLGVGIPILLDRMDPRLHYAEQVSEDMRVPILGAIPNVQSRRSKLFGGPDRAAVVEALRGVRLNLAHAYGTAGPMVLTVTSPGSGDGKTFLTANLGLTFAELGLRTLLIDGDTRRGCMHHMIEMDRKPGLTDFLAGNVDLESVIRVTPYERLDVIPCGTRSPNSPELLSGPAMGDLLAQIRARYQVILFDSPPLGAGVDPLVLATLSGNMLMVMRAGRTDRALAEAKLQMIERLPVRLLGAVLNGVKDEAGYYRYYSYLPGYEAGQDDADETRLLQPT